MLQERSISVGKARLMPEAIQTKIETQQALIDHLEAAGQTIVWVAIDGELQGAIALADTLRPEAIALVKRLKQMGIHQIMVTGDNRHSANAIAQQVGIEQVTPNYYRKIRSIWSNNCKQNIKPSPRSAMALTMHLL